MPSLVPRALGRRAVLAALAALALPGVTAIASAAPDPAADAQVTVLTREDARLTAEAARLEARLDRERSELAAARGRLDAARQGYEDALAEVQRRVVQLYKTDDVDPTAALLVDGPEGADAVVDLQRAINRGDSRMLVHFRLAMRRLDDAETDVSRRKDALTRDVAELDVRRAALAGRLETARAASGAQDAPTVPEAPFSVSVTAATVLAMPYAPPPTYMANERGLPADILATRGLPGFFAIDPVTRRGDFGALTPAPAPSAPSPGGDTAAPAAAAPTAAAFDARTSWYEGPATMADGDPFDPRALTAAHRTLPLGTWLRLSYQDRIVVVRVTDRGPYDGDRDLAITQGAAELLGLAGTGTVHAEVVTGPAG